MCTYAAVIDLVSIHQSGMHSTSGVLTLKSMHGKALISTLHFCVLQTLPLYAVTHERLGVLGTREYALRLLKTPDVTKGYFAVVEAARRGDLFKHGTV